MLKLFFIFSLCLLCIDAYKVLLLFPFPIKSINILGEGFVRCLLNDGHEVTYVTAFPMKNPPKDNFVQIDVSSTQQLFADDVALNTAYMMENEMETDPLYIQETGVNAAILAFKDKNFLRLLDDPGQRFDLVISDFVETEIYAAFAALYECPLIWAYSMGVHSVALRLVDESSNPAYTLDYLTPHLHPFSFWERVDQLWARIKWHYYKRFYTMPREVALYEEFFTPYFAKKGKPLPDYNDIIYNASMVLSNEHHAFGDIPSLPLNFKLVGGFHIEDPPKALPKDLQNLIDNAKHGVIYFSMGSTWKSKDIPQKVKEDLMKMFGELKQTVIWKYEEDHPGTPPNLHIVKWAPQQSILAHPNTLFFISHGGHLSSTEALHFGVPIIGVPVYFDQHINVKKSVKAGFALSAKLNFDLANNLRPVIQEMLNNPKYRETAKELSWVYHDRAAPGVAEVRRWARHVVRTRGAPHLRSGARRVPPPRRLYLDLAAALLAALLAAALLAARALRALRPLPSLPALAKTPNHTNKKKN